MKELKKGDWITPVIGDKQNVVYEVVSVTNRNIELKVLGDHVTGFVPIEEVKIAYKKYTYAGEKESEIIKRNCNILNANFDYHGGEVHEKIKKQNLEMNKAMKEAEINSEKESEIIKRNCGTLNPDFESQGGGFLEEKPKGIKYDSDKPMYGLVPPDALEELVKVLTFGAKKYAPDNWKNIENLDERYFDAAMRHMWAVKRGEDVDPESGFHHYAHAACCIFFMLDNVINEYDKTKL